jgi:hypothetical protein
MDLFVYWPEYKVLICRACKFAVPPDGLNPHLRRVHKDDHVDLCVHRGPAAVAKQLLSQPNRPLLDPKAEKLAIPARKIDAHPFLELHSGYQCNRCSQILCTSKGIREHVRIEHNVVRRGPGRPTSSSPYSVQDWTTVMCQRVFASGHQSNHFAVYSPAETKARKMIEQDGQVVVCLLVRLIACLRVLASITVVYEPEALKNVVFQKLLISRVSGSHERCNWYMASEAAFWCSSLTNFAFLPL